MPVTPELLLHLLVSLRHLDPHIAMLYWLLDLDNLVRFNRAWLYEDLNVSANGELAQGYHEWPENQRCLGSNPTSGNILLLDLYVFSWFCRIYRIYVHLGKTRFTKCHVKSLIVSQAPGGKSSVHTIMAIMPTWKIVQDMLCSNIQLTIVVQRHIPVYPWGGDASTRFR